MRDRRLHSALFTFAAVVLIGCTSDPATDPDASRQNESGAESPLAEYFPYSPSARGFGGRQVIDAHVATEHSSDEILRLRRIEEFVAGCMQDEGFEYVPTSPEQSQPAAPTFDEAYALDPEAFAEQYGYGLTTLMFTTEANPPPEDTDPNTAIRDGLSESARDAYDDAFWGTVEDGDDGIRQGGCHDRAYEEESEDTAPNLDEIGAEFEPLFQDIDALADRVVRDPRVEEAVAEWRACMTEHGFPGFDQLDQPYWSIHDQVSEARVPEEDPGAPDPSAAGTGVMIEGDARGFIAPERLAEITKEEISLATTDFACRVEHESTYRDVAVELERTFVEDHRAELERYRDFAAGTGAGR